MSGSSWILAELIGAVLRGRRKGQLFTVFGNLFVCMDTSPGRRAEAQTPRVRLGSWERDPVRGLFSAARNRVPKGRLQEVRTTRSVFLSE